VEKIIAAAQSGFPFLIFLVGSALFSAALIASLLR